MCVCVCVCVCVYNYHIMWVDHVPSDFRHFDDIVFNTYDHIHSESFFFTSVP